MFPNVKMYNYQIVYILHIPYQLQCRSRQKGLRKELAVTENEITASQGNM